MSPDADQEVHRNKRHFPEDVEQEQVERREDSDETELEQQQERIEHLLPLSMYFQETSTAIGVSKRGQDNEPETDTVDTDVIPDVRIVDPLAYR